MEEDARQYPIPGSFPIEEEREETGENSIPVQASVQTVPRQPGIIGCHILAEDAEGPVALIE